MPNPEGRTHTGEPPALDPWIEALAAGPRREVRPEFKVQLRRQLVGGPMPAPPSRAWLGGLAAGLALLFGIGLVWTNLRAFRAPQSGPGPAVAPVTATLAAVDAVPERPAGATPTAEHVEAPPVEPLASAPAPAALAPVEGPAAPPGPFISQPQSTYAAPSAPLPANPPPASDEDEDDPVAVPRTATPEASPTQVGAPDAPPATATPLPLIPFPTSASEAGGEAPAPPGP